MFLLVSNFFIKYFTPKRVEGITIFPFIIVSSKKNRDNNIFINHEKIHFWQQLELLVLPFFIWYGIEFLIKFIFVYQDFYLTYQNISFEKEAYIHEKDLNYLRNRKLWSFMKYI